MELSFDTEVLRKICEDEKEAEALYGPVISEQLKNRLADLWAAYTISDLVVGNPTEIQNTEIPCYQVSLKENYLLIFCANHVNLPYLESGKANWTKINRIKILSIASTNE